VWLSFSPDLKHWGDHMMLLESRAGSYWDAGKIGLATPPIETPEGWLITYYGVRRTPAGALYRLGLCLLDLDDPRWVIRRGEEWVFGPQETYEVTGDAAYVLFPSGVVHDDSSDELRVYYGAADSSICLATAKVSDILDWLLAQSGALTTRRRAGDHGPL
jgi:predicted GH43/DUF377 family glycosyl hydrolase